MSETNLLFILLTQYGVQAPVLLAVLIACAVVLVRRREMPSEAMAWALVGFGLALLTGLVVPVVQMLVRRWLLTQEHMVAVYVGEVFTAIGLASSLLHALSYGCLLAAVLAGRRQRPPSFPLQSGDTPPLGR